MSVLSSQMSDCQHHPVHVTPQVRCLRCVQSGHVVARDKVVWTSIIRLLPPTTLDKDKRQNVNESMDNTSFFLTMKFLAVSMGFDSLFLSELP